MDKKDFILVNDEIINVSFISKITYDKEIDKYIISISGEPHIEIDKNQYIAIKSHLKVISNSFIEIL